MRRSPLLAVRHLPALQRHFGTRWLAGRALYDLKLRTGVLRRRLPASSWDDRRLADFLSDPSLSDADRYLDYRRAGAPSFFFSAAQREGYAPLLKAWDEGPHSPVRSADSLTGGVMQYFEHTDARSNVGQQSPVDVVRIPYADLTVDTVTVQALDANVGFRNGAPIRVSWIVSNVSPNGIGPTDEASWTDRIYISASADGQNLRQIGSLTHFGALGLRESYTASVELTLPIDTAGGPQYLYVGGPACQV